MKHMGEAREEFMRTKPSRCRARNEHLGWRGADDRARPAFEKGDWYLSRGGASLVRVHRPEPSGSRALQRAKEGGSTIALDITKDDDSGWKYRWLHNAVEGTIQ
jgi:hypothetical protein